MLDVGYDTLTIIVSTAGLLWLFVRQTNRQIDALRTDVTRQLDAQRAEFTRQLDAQRADTARQFETRRADTAALRADFTRQLDAQRADTAALRADFTRQLDAQHADTARQFEALRIEHREGLAQVGERVAELRADFRAVLPRAAAEPVGRPQAPVVVTPQRREDQPATPPDRPPTPAR